MKKVVSLLLVSALLIGALSACKRNEPEPEPAPPEPVTPTYDYRRGIRRLLRRPRARPHARLPDHLDQKRRDHDRRGGLQGGRFAARPVGGNLRGRGLRSHGTAAPSEPASSDASSEAAPAGESEYEAKANAQMKDIVAEYEAVEGDLERMEPVEGAEEHTYRFMRMMRTALKFAKAGDHTPSSSANMRTAAMRRSCPPSARAAGRITSASPSRTA